MKPRYATHELQVHEVTDTDEKGSRIPVAVRE